MIGKVTCVGILQKSVPHQKLLGEVSVVVARRTNSSVASQAVNVDWASAKPYEAIPGPTPLPILGNTLRFLPVIGDLVKLRETSFLSTLNEKYGNIYKISGIPGRADMVIVYDPDDIEKVFRNEGQWPIRETLAGLGYYRTVERKEKFNGVIGLGTTQGKEWQHFRTKVNQPMMQPRATKLYVAPIDDVSKDFINRIRYIRDDKQEMPADFNNELYKWGLESIVYIALDTRIGSLEKDLKPDSEPQKMIDAVQVQFEAMYRMEVELPIWKYISTPMWKKFVKSSDYFFDVAMKYISQAMIRLKSLPEDSDRELTVLEKLLARDPDPKTAIVMALDMMTAGIDTTAYSAAVAIYYLAKNPDKQQIAFEEVRKYLPDKDQPITSEILGELKYLKACIKESMRMSPIAPANQRTLVKDLILGGYRVPKGTDIIMPLLVLSNKDKYFPQAKKFIPERWMKNGPFSETKVHPFISMPFGFGPRMCIGRRFAELEIETLLTRIIRNFNVEYNYGEMKFETRLLYMPVSPLKFKFVDREN